MEIINVKIKMVQVYMIIVRHRVTTKSSSKRYDNTKIGYQIEIKERPQIKHGGQG